MECLIYVQPIGLISMKTKVKNTIKTINKLNLVTLNTNFLIPVFALILISSASFAEQANITVADAKGKKLKDVVVFLEPQFKQSKATKPVDILIDQRDKEFIPLITAVQVGTSIRFPNNDKIRHHVYSFSKSKSFEIPLYKDVDPTPIVFDKVGVVPLGCNIHDWMNAFVFVSKTPYFSLTDKNGNAQIKNLPQGKYQAKLYHPSMKNWKKQRGKTIQVSSTKTSTIQMQLNKKKRIFRSFRPPTGSGTSSYR